MAAVDAAPPALCGLTGSVVGWLADVAPQPKTIVDIGCSTGLSTLKLQSTFPEAEVLGLDLSPYMLAVAKYNLRTRPEQRQVSRRRQGRPV